MQDIFRKNLDSDSESDDEDYVPDELVDKKTKKAIQKEQQINLKRQERVKSIWEEMKQDYQAKESKRSDIQEELTLEDVKNLMSKVREQQPQPQKIRFAGQTYDLSAENEYKILEPCDENNNPASNGDANAKQEIKDESEEKKEVEASNGEKIEDETQEIQASKEPQEKEVTIGQKYAYLKSLLSIIETKNINSMTKSKFDWKDYTNKSNMEKQFAENRKDGFIEKKKFLEKSRQEQKNLIKSRKKVKV